MGMILFQVVKYEMSFVILFKTDITISMHRASLFPSDLTMISYFNISRNVIIVTNPTFSRALKVFIVFFSHHKFLIKIFFITPLQYLLSSIALM